MKHHSKTIESLKLQNRLLWTFAYFVVLGGLLYVTQDRVLSPCSDQGCHIQVKTVYAQDSDSEFERIVAYITKKFAPEGKHVVVKAIQCFYSESGLRSEAYNYNPSSNSEDIGVAQVNLKYHPHVSKKDMFDFRKNIDEAYKIYKSRKNFSAWYGPKCN